VEDYLYFIILFFIFFVLPMLEKIFGRGKQQAPPQPEPQRRPQPEEEQAAQFERAERQPAPAARTGDRPVAVESPPADDPAAEMIPDELWEILTGEKRQRPGPPPPAPQRPVPETRRPEPEPEPEPEPDWGPWEIEQVEDEEEAYERHAASHAEEIEAERLRERRARDARRTPVRPPPRVVAFERASPTARSGRAMAAPAPRQPPSPRGRDVTRREPLLGHLPELHRAIVLAEVFGRPKGLEDER
jgi:hypothetical protein